MASVSELPKKDSHVCLNEIECYLRHQNYPEHVQSKGDKANFRRAAKKFSIRDGIFTYGTDRMVITEKEKRIEIIRNIHKQRCRRKCTCTCVVIAFWPQLHLSVLSTTVFKMTGNAFFFQQWGGP